MASSLWRLIRPAQWLKNGVLFAGLIFAGEIGNMAQVKLSVMALAVFCLLSSAVYTLNDLLDREKDRLHPLKKERPLASGKISTGTAVVLAVTLLIVGLAGGWLVNRDFFAVCLVFVLLNVAYSLWLKNMVILDAMSVAFSFVIRAFAGAVAITVPASKWMLLNTLFLALFLAFGKRRHELVLLQEHAEDHRSILGKYTPYLLDQLIGLVTASALVTYMLYTFSSEVSTKLGTEYLFITIPFVVYGLFRYLYLIHKEEMGGSPTSIMISDTPLQVNILLWLAVVIWFLY